MVVAISPTITVVERDQALCAMAMLESEEERGCPPKSPSCAFPFHNTIQLRIATQLLQCTLESTLNLHNTHSAFGVTVLQTVVMHIAWLWREKTRYCEQCNVKSSHMQMVTVLNAIGKYPG